MSYKLRTIHSFDRDVKRLAKHYHYATISDYWPGVIITALTHRCLRPCPCIYS